MGKCLYDLFIYPIELVVELIYVYANRILNDPGLSIIAVSLVVNFLVLPLYNQSDAMQQREREKQASMDHWVKHIKKAFKGDERFMILSAYYRQQDYKPIYALRGAFSLLLQIPFFMAAYHFLSNLSQLRGTPFWIISDLSRPDALLHIGSLSLNALPLLMTLFNLISGAIYTRGFKLQEKLQLYGMAALFLILLYNRPAGLVFYWTLNNLFSLLKNIVQKLLPNPKGFMKGLIALMGAGFAVSMFASGSVYSVSRALIILIVAFCCQLPWMLSLLKKAGIRLPQAASDADNSLFRTAMLFFSLFAGGVIASGIISSCPEDFTSGTSPQSLILHNLLIAVGFFLIWGSIFYSLFSEKGKSGFLTLAVGLVPVVTANFYLYGSELGVMSALFVFDKEPAYTTKAKLISLLVNLAIFGISALILWKKKAVMKGLVRIMVLFALGIGIMNVFNIRKEMKIYEASMKEAETAASEKKQESMIRLSTGGKNVIVFMLDRGISGYVPYILQEKPELMETFGDFTWYTNTLTFGSHTNMAAPALFGGYEYRPHELNQRTDRNLRDKYDESLLLLPTLFSENDYEVSVIDPPYAGFKYTADLSIFRDLKNTSAYKLMGTVDGEDPELFASFADLQQHNLFLYSIFRCAPLFLQNNIYDGGKYYRSFMPVDSDFLNSYYALGALPELTEILQDTTNTYTVADNDTAHYPTTLSMPDYKPSMNGEYGERAKSAADGSQIELRTDMQATIYQVNMAAFLQFDKWFDYLKENGVWDNTRIILVSDHGYKSLRQFKHLDVGVDMWTDSYVSLLMVKDFGQSGFTQKDDFMTTADVPLLAMEGLIENPVNPFTGNPITDKAKYEEPLYVATSGHYELDKATDQFMKLYDSAWYEVSEDIWKTENWVPAELEEP